MQVASVRAAGLVWSGLAWSVTVASLRELLRDLFLREQVCEGFEHGNGGAEESSENAEHEEEVNGRDLLKSEERKEGRKEGRNE